MTIDSPTPAPPRRTGAPFRLSGRASLILMAVLAIVLVYATDQIAPATSDRQAQLRIWLAARATGIVTFLLLTFQVCVGLVLSHPTNKSTWKLSKRLFPWHEHLWVFVCAFLGVHVASLVLDPYAGVGVAGAFIPGLSTYRSSAVALGILAGTDSDVLRAMYVGAGLAVLSASSYRDWTARRGRPTFATSRTEVTE